MARQVPGYALGSKEVPPAPIDRTDLQRILDTADFTGQDAQMLRRSRDILEKHADALVSHWFDLLLEQDHLAVTFEDPETNKINGPYVEAVRARYKQWLLDTAEARLDQEWLDYQFEIGRRLHRAGKNQTDDVRAAEHVPFRYLAPMSVSMLETLRTWFEKDGATVPEIDRMVTAWDKMVLVQITLWSYQYVGEADY